MSKNLVQINATNPKTSIANTDLFYLVRGGNDAAINGQNFKAQFVSSGALSGVTGTGAFVGSNSPTLVTPNLDTPTTLVLTNATGDQLGVTDGSNAAAGHVGEFVSSVILSSSAVTLVTAVAKNITSISLTAGDWFVWGNVAITMNPANNDPVGWISTVSATRPDFAFNLNLNLTVNAQSIYAGSVLAQRFSLGSTTTIFLGGFGRFTTSGTAYGAIYAIRVR